MLVSEIKMVPYGKWCQLQALVTSGTLERPFPLYYRFPPAYEQMIDPRDGDPFLATLLIPAMSSGETLEIHGEVSPKLMRATAKIQENFSSWNRRLSRIVIKAPVRNELAPAAQGTRRGLFFSCGIDSFYSLLRDGTGCGEDSSRITDLIVICGFDISHKGRSSRLYGRLLDNSRKIARKLGIQTLPVVTNAKSFSDRYLHSYWCQGGLLAGVGLSLQRTFKEILVSSTHSYDRLVPAGSNPVTDPLWSTESLTFVHDGYETTRINKIRFVANSPLAMETLRVCSQSYATLAYSPKLYNCGICEKCTRTMVGLHIAGKLPMCKTLPHALDVELLRNINRAGYLRPHTEELINNLGSSRFDLMIKSALQDSLEKSGERRVRKRILRTGTYLVSRYVPDLMPLWQSFARALLRVRISFSERADTTPLNCAT